uniref:Uncharacterized protein n=1 Tax=Arundo donax TaxID=35708 RepID=A0A0A9H6A4_ARUDO
MVNLMTSVGEALSLLLSCMLLLGTCKGVATFSWKGYIISDIILSAFVIYALLAI